MEKVIKFEGDDDQPELLHANEVDKDGMITIGKSVAAFILREIAKSNPEKEGMYCGGCIKTILFNSIVEVINCSDAAPDEISHFGEMLGAKIEELAVKHMLRNIFDKDGVSVTVIKI